MLGIELTGRVAEESDERRAFLPFRGGVAGGRRACHCSDLITRSHAIAPSRTSVGTPPSMRTIVDGAPPATRPPSRIRSTAGTHFCTASAVSAGGSPDAFALVAVS